jgi:hypothetical protein
MQTEIFGDLPASSPITAKMKIQDGPFEDREVEKILEDVPGVLMDGFIDAIRNYRHWRSSDRRQQPNVDLLGDTAIESAKARLFENIAWAFDLYESPSVADFEWVCAEKEADPEHMRAYLTRAFSGEIREFALAVHRVYPSIGRRIQQRMRGYLDIPLELH